MDYNEIILSGETVYKGRIINLRKDIVKLPNGKEADREVVEHSGGVGILAIDADDNVIMVRQYRHGTGHVSLEIPAGKLNPGEIPAECGSRELEEETGYTPGIFEPFGVLEPTPAYCSERIYVYLAKNLTQSAQNLDEDEFLSVEHIPLEEAVRMCLSGEISDAKTLFAVLKYKLLAASGKKGKEH